MIPGAFIYRSPQEITGLYDHFWGGLFLVKGLPLLVQLLALSSFLLAAASGVFSQVKNARRFGSVSILLSLTGFTAFVTLLHQPWDEVFVNLMHAKNWSEHGTFSFQSQKAIEGTVDTLPYFLLGVLNKVGLPLVEMTLLFSLLGGLSCVLLASACIVSACSLRSFTWPVFFFSLYAPLLFNSSHGFSTTLFTAAILASLYFIDIKKKKLGWFILAIVPLTRTEGLWFVLLFLIRELVVKKERNGWKFCTLIPAGVLVGWRFHTFGFLTPVPMHFKATFGNFFFFLLGFRNLWCDLLASYSLLFLLFYWILRKKEKTLDQWLVLTLLNVLPYYLSGGDWFPAAWGRYLLPFSVITAIAFGTSLIKNLPVLSRETHLKFTPLIFASFLFLVLPSSSYVGLFEDIFTKKKTLSNSNYRAKARTNFRIHYLSQVGTHLGHTTAPHDVIGTSEIATIHFFADRPALDLLGITNQEIADEPLRTPILFRKFPTDNELPYLIFRRVKPSLVEKYHPTIIYPFDFILRDLLQDVPFHEIDDPTVIKALTRWENRFKGLMEPLYGGTERLLNLGYQPFIVLYANEFATLYFVARERVEAHLSYLRTRGFSGRYFPF